MLSVKCVIAVLNLRNLMLLQRKPTIEEITIDQLTKSTYVEIPTGDEWKIHLAKELLDAKNGHLDIEILNKAEDSITLRNIMTSTYFSTNCN